MRAVVGPDRRRARGRAHGDEVLDRGPFLMLSLPRKRSSLWSAALIHAGGCSRAAKMASAMSCMAARPATKLLGDRCESVVALVAFRAASRSSVHGCSDHLRLAAP